MDTHDRRGRARPGPTRVPPGVDPRNIQQRPLKPWPLIGWVVVGMLWAFSLAAAFSFGLFVMPLALIGTVYMCLGYTRPDGWPGLIAGIGLIAFYLAYLHRHGPGEYCTTSGDVHRCTEYLNPWMFLIGGVVIILTSALISWRWYTQFVTLRYRR